jgi:hypothetical protein
MSVLSHFVNYVDLYFSPENVIINYDPIKKIVRQESC